MIDTDYTLFQKWILLQNFNQLQPQQTSQILLHCCDSALTDDLLSGDNVDAQIKQLVDNGLLSTPNAANMTITNQGILFTRIKLLRPITSLTDRSDFDDFLSKLPDGELTNILITERKRNEENKIGLIERLRNYGINNMSKYVVFLNQVISLSEKLPEP